MIDKQIMTYSLRLKIKPCFYNTLSIRNQLLECGLEIETVDKLCKINGFNAGAISVLVSCPILLSKQPFGFTKAHARKLLVATSSNGSLVPHEELLWEESYASNLKVGNAPRKLHGCWRGVPEGEKSIPSNSRNPSITLHGQGPNDAEGKGLVMRAFSLTNFETIDQSDGVYLVDVIWDSVQEGTVAQSPKGSEVRSRAVGFPHPKLPGLHVLIDMHCDPSLICDIKVMEFLEDDTIIIGTTVPWHFIFGPQQPTMGGRSAGAMLKTAAVNALKYSNGLLYLREVSLMTPALGLDYLEDLLGGIRPGGYSAGDEAMREVECSVEVLKIPAVETPHERFEVKFVVTLTWAVAITNGILALHDGDNWVPDWKPARPVLLNTIDLECRDSLRPVVRKGTYFARWQITYSAHISENFELRNFPFDVQDLPIQLKFPLDVALVAPKLEWEATARSCFSFNAQNILSSGCGWVCVGGHCSLLPQPKEEGGEPEGGPLLLLCLQVERCWRPYCWNVILVLFLICAQLFVPYNLDAIEQFSDRISYIVTLFLAAVAYQFVATQDLPKLNYLTVIDKLIVAVLSLITLNMVLLALTKLTARTSIDEFSLWFTTAAVGFMFGGLWLDVALHILPSERRKVGGGFAVVASEQTQRRDWAGCGAGPGSPQRAPSIDSVKVTVGDGAVPSEMLLHLPSSEDSCEEEEKQQLGGEGDSSWEEEGDNGGGGSDDGDSVGVAAMPGMFCSVFGRN